MSFDGPNFTQIPNFYIDNIMMTLSPAENKVMIVVFRYTTGYLRRSGKISISHFMQQTGLSNRCVIDCIKSLEQRGFIRVHRKERQTSTIELVIKECPKSKKAEIEEEPLQDMGEKSSEPREEGLVNSVHKPSELSSPALVNSVHCIKKDKEKLNNNQAPKTETGQKIPIHSDTPAAVVVPSCLLFLSGVTDSLKQKLATTWSHDLERLEKACEVVRNYKGAREPSAVLHRALSEGWHPSKSVETIVETNQKWKIEWISPLDGKKCGAYMIQVCESYVEFAPSGNAISQVFEVKDPGFKELITNFIKKARLIPKICAPV